VKFHRHERRLVCADRKRHFKQKNDNYGALAFHFGLAIFHFLVGEVGYTIGFRWFIVDTIGFFVPFVFLWITRRRIGLDGGGRFVVVVRGVWSSASVRSFY